MRTKFGPRKPTGEARLFELIAEQRRASDGYCYSQVNPATRLVEKGHPDWAKQFSHILPKGAYPEYRLDPRNIVMCSAEEHRMWGEERTTFRKSPYTKWIFRLEELLKREAYGLQ